MREPDHQKNKNCLGILWDEMQYVSQK